MSSNSSTGSFFKVVLVGALTFVSRITGLIREAVKAYFLGTGPLADAFNMAFTIPNLFRRLTAEGAMLASFIPFLAQTENDGAQAQRDFIGAFTVKLLIILSLLSLGVILFSDFWIRSVFAAGFDEPTAAVSADMLQIMFVYIVFISLSAVLQGILNYHGHFGIVSFTPVVLNAVIIGAAFIYSQPQDVALAMSWGVVIGGFIQMAMLYPAACKLGFPVLRLLRLKSATATNALKSMIPGVWGAGVYQLNIVISNLLATSLGAGAISALIYSNRLLELALGVFVVSMNTVFFPGFAKTLAEKNVEKSSKMTTDNLCSISFLTLPITVGLIFTGQDLIRLLFERGEFDSRSTDMTFLALMFHAPGMIFIGWNRLLSSICNAYRLFRMLLVVSIFGAVSNVVLCLLLAMPLRHGGIALASSVSQMMVTGLLVAVIYKKQLIVWHYRRLGISLLKHTVAAAAMIPAIVIYQNTAAGHIPAVFDYAVIIILSGSVYAAAALLLRCQEAVVIGHMLMKKVRSKPSP